MRAVFTAACFLVSSASADIIIDDFDDPAHSVSPAMDNVFVPTEHVGPLDAFREIRLSSFGADPDATMQIAGGQMRATVGDLHGTGNLRPQFGAQLYYEFEPTDFSSGNAFLFDFKSVSGSVLPEAIRVLIFDDDPRYSYYAEFKPVPAGSYTAAIPFADFIRRDGVPHDINFTKIWRVWPDIYANQNLADYSNHNWTIEVERIRVGTVPEPRRLYWFLFTVFLWRKRRWEPFCWS